MRRNGVDDPPAEARDVVAQLDRDQIRTGIETDDELGSLLLNSRREPVGEVLGHRRTNIGRGPVTRPS
jgi:hypothetical protein